VVTVMDPCEVDLPGELAGEHWQAVEDMPCSACFDRCTPGPFGLCVVCAQRYRLLGAGCGQAVQLVAALDGGAGVPVLVLYHLVECQPCRNYLSGLVAAVEVAEQENTHTTLSLAAQVA
jgi:hypothetical protein